MSARMETLSQRQRLVVYQVLTDFFCPGCGIEQPYGDCQCRSQQ